MNWIFILDEIFIKKIHIKEEEFLRDADSLDLVFFKGKSLG